MKVYKGHDHMAGIDVLVTVYDDGSISAATRPGADERWTTWSPQFPVTEEPTE